MFLSERTYTSWLTLYWVAKMLLLVLLLVSALHVFVSSNDSDTAAEGSVLFVIDVSKSMDVADIDGGRLSRKSFIRDTLDTFVSQYPGYSYGVIVFAQEARTLVPMTTDPNILSTFLGSLESFDSLP